MDFILFTAFFASFIVVFIPFIAFVYKLYEKKLKRALYAKASQQIGLFSAILSALIAFAFIIDIPFNGTLVQVTSASTVAGEMAIAPIQYFYASIAGFACISLFSFCYYKTKNLVLILVACILSVGTLYALVSWLYFICNADISSVLSSTFFFPSFISHLLFGGVTETFMPNSFAFLNNALVWQVLLLAIFYCSVIVMLFHLLIIVTFIVRNKMDFGRDYYTIILNSYGSKLCLNSFILFVLIALTTILYEPSLQNGFELFIKTIFPVKTFFAQIALAIIPLIYLLLSIKIKKSFALAPIPMQKKSAILITFVFDFALIIGYFTLLCNAF